MRLETNTRLPQAQTHAAPLLFIHGMWHGAWCWDEFFLPFFAEHGYHATALSLRGHAGSEGRIHGSRITDYVADVEQVVRTFETHPILIGHSMGGFITQKYLETHNAPAAAILGSIPYFGLWRGFGRVLRRNPSIVLKALLTLNLRPVVDKPADARWALFSAAFSEEKLLEYHAKLDDESFRAFLDLLGLNLANPKKVKTPILILGGQDDTVIKPRDIHDTARGYGVQAELLPNVAHDMMLEAGWKSVAERILEWLKERGI